MAKDGILSGIRKLDLKTAIVIVVCCILGIAVLSQLGKTPRGVFDVTAKLLREQEHRYVDKSGLNLVAEDIMKAKQCFTCIDPKNITVLSWNPRIILYKNFLSEAECEHMIQTGVSLGLTRSRVAASKNGDETNNVRTSSGTFFSGVDDPITRGIEERIAKWSHIPPQNGEVIYLLKYEISQEYKPHHDYFNPAQEGMDRYIGPSGNRYATVLMYLETPEQGGETTFPSAGLKVPAIKGDAVLFWSQTPDWQLDRSSLHGSLPVIKGVKFAATKWMRIKRYTNRW